MGTLAEPLIVPWMIKHGLAQPTPFQRWVHDSRTLAPAEPPYSDATRVPDDRLQGDPPFDPSAPNSSQPTRCAVCGHTSAPTQQQAKSTSTSTSSLNRPTPSAPSCEPR